MGKISLIYENLRSTLKTLPRPQPPKLAQGFFINIPKYVSTASLNRLVQRSRERLNSAGNSLRSSMPPGSGSGGGGGLCSCLLGGFGRSSGSEEPPEITYTVVNGPLAAVLTPPHEINKDELDAKFADFVEELDLSLPNKTAMLSLPIEKKWQIFCSRKNEGDQSLVSLSPEYYIDRVTNLMPQEESPIKLFESLRTALRTQPNSFVQRFLELRGLQCLLDVLSDQGHCSCHAHVITCVKSLMNNSGGRAHVLQHENSLEIISESLAGDNIKGKVDVLEILGAVCLVPGGHRKVLNAINYLQNFGGERARFQTILNDLDRSTGPYRQDVTLKTAIMSFINAVLSYGAGQQSLEFRLHLRYELLMLGIEPIIAKLRSFENQTLDKHIDFFEMVRMDDEKEFSRRWGESHVNTKNVDEMFELVKMRLSHSYAFTNLQSIFSHLLMLPLNIGSPPPYHWALIDRLIQQIVLQRAESECSLEDTDHVILPDLNVKDLVERLEDEEERRATIEKLENVLRENQVVKCTLTSKEQELELKIQESEDLSQTISRLRDRLEKESLLRLEESQRVAELELKIKNLSFAPPPAQPHPQQMAHSQSQAQNGPHPLQQTNTASPQVIQRQPTRSNSQSPSKSVSGSPSSSSSQVTPNTSNGPPPPPPPPGPPPMPNGMGGNHPPPPPPPSILPMTPAAPLKSKNIPQASAPLKSFNWSKLPDTKLQGTLWSELEESSIYSILDLKEIDRLFSAYQKNGISSSGGVENQNNQNGHGSGGDLNNGGVGGNLNMHCTLDGRKSSGGGGNSSRKVISVIDSRRGQNCTILLSKLKMSDEEICQAILSMDVSDNLPLDMIEQLLKFTPSTEEVTLLEEHSEDLLARADSFLLKISRITHYEERLRVLHYKKRFPHIVEENTCRMKTVLEACRELSRSRKLRKMLELVLALGNYMNRGGRGNASGFRLFSLIRLQDTKSNQRNQNLMNYLAHQVETYWGELLDLENEVGGVRGAAKVSLTELEKDMSYLRQGLEHVNKEVEFQRGLQKMETGDRFLPSIREFLSTAVLRIQELEDSFVDMKTHFTKTVRMFGEDYTQIDEFFGVFDQFLAAFTEAKLENESLRKRKEDEEKRAAEATLRRTSKSCVDRTNSANIQQQNSINHNLKQNGGEFDDLISALRTGDVFTEDVTKYKRSRGRQNHNRTNSRSDLTNSRERIH